MIFMDFLKNCVRKIAKFFSKVNWLVFSSDLNSTAKKSVDIFWVIGRPETPFYENPTEV